MRKRQRKKNQKKVLKEFNRLCEEMQPRIKASKFLSFLRCCSHGHDYRDARRYGLDFDGVFCMCCGKKLPRLPVGKTGQVIEKMSEEGRNAAQAGKAMARELYISFPNQKTV